MKHIRSRLGSGLHQLLRPGLRAGRFGAAVLALFLCACQTTDAQKNGPDEAKSLERQVRRASRAKNFRPSSPDAVYAAERLFVRTLRGTEPIDVLRDAWAELQFELDVMQLPDHQLWLLHESQSHETGRGFYAFRPTAKLPVAIQAPHSFADTNTRRLTAQLFINSRFSAATWNTVHRKTVDTAHTDICFLNAFTRAFLRVHGHNAVVCQLHGFARAKRTTERGRTSDLIVSNGSRAAEWWLHRTVLSFRKMWPDIAVRLFPNEVSELGATTNRQARLVRQTGVGRFLHLEMSAELRGALIHQADKRSELLKTLELTFRLQPSGNAEKREFKAKASGVQLTPPHPHD